MKKSVFSFSLLFTLFLFACKSDPGQQSGNEGNATETAIAPESVKLICQAVEEPNMQADAPQHEVFLQIGDSKVKVANILNCETLTPDLYEQYQIPKETLSAVGGWWAGAGDYVYVLMEGENYVVKQGDMDEGRTDNSYNYKTVITFSKAGKEVF